MVREGLSLLPLTDEWAAKQTHMWAEVFRRDRRTQTETLRYMTNAMYVMAGVSEAVAPKTRYDVLKPFQDRVEAHVNKDAHTVAHHKAIIEAKIRGLKQEKALFDRVTEISSGSFSISDWMDGK